MRRIWVLPLLAGAFLACQTGPARAPSPAGLQDKVDAFLQPFIDAGGFSGAILMAKGGHVLLAKGYGLADQEFGVPADVRTKFQIASLSKSFTAAAILLLQERGRLTVRDPLSRFMPDYAPAGRITLHHLLTHTSGVPNANDLPEYERESRFPHTLEETIALFKARPLRFEPGTRYEYSNSNYNLLALVIEKASGQSYGDFLDQNIFGPLGMRDTAHRGTAGRIVPLLAPGYAPAGAWGLERAPFLDWSIKTGNGSLYSTVEDLYKWDRALREGGLLRPASLSEMFKDHTEGAGYGWFVGERSGRATVRFSGRSPGYTSYFERYPDDDACVIILSNNYAPVPGIAVGGLRAILFGEPYTTPVFDRTFKADAASLGIFEGRYRFGPDFYRKNAEVAVKATDGTLEIVWSGSYATPLRPVAPAVFLDRTFWATILFQKDAAGEVTGFVWRDSDDYPAARLK